MCPVAAKFYFQNFNDRTELNLVGDMSRVDSCLGLPTDRAQLEQTGAVWYAKRLDLSQGFSTTFTVRIPNPPAKFHLDELRSPNVSHRHPLPAAQQVISTISSLHDLFGLRRRHYSSAAFAFVVHSSGDRAVGEGRTGGGYEGLFHGLAVEFEQTQDIPEHDPNNNHVSVHDACHAPLSPFETDQRLVVNTSAVIVVCTLL